MSAHKADEIFILEGGAGVENSPPSAGIPRQVRYVVTRGVIVARRLLKQRYKLS